MDQTPPSSPRASGALIAILTIAGALIGAFNRQPSAGFLIGLGSGSLIALALYLRDRARGR